MLLAFIVFSYAQIRITWEFAGAEMYGRYLEASLRQSLIKENPNIRNREDIHIRRNRLDFLELQLPDGVAESIESVRGYQFKSIWILESPKFRDISPLEGMPLEEVYLCFTSVSDLSPIRNASISILDIRGTDVVSLSPLEEAKLFSLSIRMTKIKDLTPLSGMPLRYLDIAASKVSDITPISTARLERIYAEGAPIFDITALKGMPIKTAILRNTMIQDLSPLKDSPLGFIDIVGTPAADRPLPVWLPKYIVK